jgi:hypothetical protein
MTRTAVLTDRSFISEAIVIQVLSEPEFNDREMAKRVGIARATVQRIRTGDVYASVRPDLPRRPKKQRSFFTISCWNCIHHTSFQKPRKNGSTTTQAAVACGLGLPDPLEVGAYFARQCAAYKHHEDT